MQSVSGVIINFFFEPSTLVAGTRNLANEVRGRSNMAGKDFANDRHSFAMIGVRFLEKLYAAAQDGKGRALNRHEYKLNV